MKDLFGCAAKIDHVAIAVKDMDEALFFYQGILNFKLLERREIKGAFSGMKSAELTVGNFSVVLVQGTGPESQVCKYIDEYGPGVQHVAITVEDIEEVARVLTEQGLEFSTNIIKGKGLLQIFTKREKNSGMMYEFIQREETETGFEEGNIQELFNQLESAFAY
ncbi:VOC family protein [Pseudoalteromonas piscicida]|uniref:VOC family protein n=1 Tax=Pseudoalteromonas piscicida TaxID=43662 RepID=UPI0032C0E389